MPHMSRVVAIDFPHHPTQRGNYQECVSEDKDGLTQRLGCPGDCTVSDPFRPKQKFFCHNF